MSPIYKFVNFNNKKFEENEAGASETSFTYNSYMLMYKINYVKEIFILSRRGLLRSLLLVSAQFDFSS